MRINNMRIENDYFDLDGISQIVIKKSLQEAGNGNALNKSIYNALKVCRARKSSSLTSEPKNARRRGIAV